MIMNKNNAFKEQNAVSYTRYSSNNQRETSIESQDKTIEIIVRRMVSTWFINIVIVLIRVRLKQDRHFSK